MLQDGFLYLNYFILNKSAQRMNMPLVPEEIFMEGVRQLIALDKEWIPSNLRYDMIGAMIEVIKEFQFFTGVKIIISLKISA